jgi:dienelactone hydrolase
MTLRRVFYATLLCLPASLWAQGTLADYERALQLREHNLALAYDIPERASWIGGTTRFWYRKSVKGGYEFITVDTSTLVKTPAFDQQKLAAALSKAAGEQFEPLKLPFQTINFVEEGKAIEFNAGESRWKVDLSTYSCQRLGDSTRQVGFRNPRPPENLPVTSPNGKWEAVIRNFNVFIREKGKKHDEIPLSFDGSEANYYRSQSIAWSPDSTKLVAYRIRPGYHRKIQFVESSPVDQLQPKYSTLEYAKPGDVVDLPQPVLFDVEGRKALPVNNRQFPNPYELSRAVWRKDSRAFSFEYNERGHQVYRVLEVNAASGEPRTVIDEESPTFFCYSGKKYRHDLNEGREIVWMSERDGWNHLYLYDGVTGKVKNQITKGNWVVRGVDKVDDEKRQVWFHANGMYPGQDPYFVHYYRINLDGSGLTRLTEADANHTVAFSSDMKYYVDTWSRVDLPPTSELRRAEDGKTVAPLEHGDIAALQADGWHAPEVFTSKGRDGETDIWGIILRPANFDASKKYPVIESIYAGPQDSFVPKSFSAYYPMQAMAELGFVVVQIDGMGTSNRSKAFHDVCWKNLADAGFPDRILWHQAVAAKYSWYDITRVGIYGHSAGGQNALGGLLFHPEFYKAAVASCGCHDNRMDKIWWNEQWMGWPLGPEYVVCSNVENAYKLKGKLLLSVGEMDNNVDPASTMQVVNALIKAGKTFDLLVFPGQGHSPGGVYGERKRFDFFVHQLLNVEPPDWNVLDKKLESPRPAGLGTASGLPY